MEGWLMEGWLMEGVVDASWRVGMNGELASERISSASSS